MADDGNPYHDPHSGEFTTAGGASSHPEPHKLAAAGSLAHAQGVAAADDEADDDSPDEPDAPVPTRDINSATDGVTMLGNATPLSKGPGDVSVVNGFANGAGQVYMPPTAANAATQATAATAHASHAQHAASVPNITVVAPPRGARQGVAQGFNLKNSTGGTTTAGNRGGRRR